MTQVKQRLEAIFQNFSEAVYIKNREGEYLFINDAGAEVFGLEPDEVEGKTDDDLFDSESAQKIRRDDRKVMESGNTITWERQRFIDGKKHYFMDNKFPYRDNDDNVVGVMGLSRDITDLKETKLRLKQSDILFRNSQDAIFVIDVDNGIYLFERVNPAYQKLTGIPAEQLEGNTIQEVFEPDDAESIRAKYNDCIASKTPTKYVEKLDVPEEDSYWETSIAPVITEGNVSKLVGTTRNITEHKNRESKLKRFNQRLKEIVKTQESISGSIHDRERVMDLIVDRVQDLTRSDGTAIEINEDDSMVCKSASGILDDQVGLELPVEKSLSGLCYLDGEMKRCDNVETDDRVPYSDLAKKIGIYSMLLIPLEHSGECFGTLKTAYSEPSDFTETEETVMNLLGGLLASALRQSREYEKNEEYLRQAQEMARTDPLTGLSNRRKLLKDLRKESERAQRKGHNLSFGILDLDHFKEVNDQYGHPKGDDVLRKIGGLLEEDTRSYDTVGRYGGEEFGIVLPETSIDTAEDIFGRILDKLREHDFESEGETFRVTASAGVTQMKNDTQGIDTMIQRADRALYDAKKNGRDQYCKH